MLKWSTDGLACWSEETDCRVDVDARDDTFLREEDGELDLIVDEEDG